MLLLLLLMLLLILLFILLLILLLMLLLMLLLLFLILFLVLLLQMTSCSCSELRCSFRCLRRRSIRLFRSWQGTTLIFMETMGCWPNKLSSFVSTRSQTS